MSHRILSIAIVTLLSSACAAPAAEDAVSTMRRQLDRVMDRLAAVEAENRSLKARIDTLQVVPALPGPVEEAKAAPLPAALRPIDAEPGATPASLTPSAASAYDAHLRRAPALPRPGAARVIGHLAVNTWSGDDNVALRAGPNGTTNVWDAAVGIQARLGDDTALRMRAFTVLPTIGGDGDGFGNGRDYAYLRDAYLVAGRLFGSDAVNLRFGRMPYAFGEEYLQFDAPANPLVSHSAAFFWGYDEGAQLFGQLGGGLSYTLTFNMDGETGNGSDSTASKARGVRVAGDHGRHWHWSASYFDASTARVSELWIGAEPITPVGFFSSTGAPGGNSPSATVGSRFAELDARYEARRGRITVAGGRGSVNDASALHDRPLEWFKVEPIWWFRPRWYAAGRYSELRVRDRALGYAIRPFESGGFDLGFDVNELERLTLGLGFRAGERLTYKLEHTMDQFSLIPTALLRNPGPDDRNYTVLQAAAEF